MLPKPSASFEWILFPAGPALVCGALGPVARHFFTSRQWPLGSGSTPDGWLGVAEAAGVGPAHLFRLRQVHGADAIFVRGADSPFDTPPPADIIASDAPDAAVAVQAADCVPILIADRHTGVVAAVHAGWRGLLAGAPRVAVDALCRQFGSRPDDLVSGVGPCIGACCYEVGEEVRAQFMATSGDDGGRWFLPEPATDAANPPFRRLGASPGKWFFDAWRAAADQLRDAGVPNDAIHVARLCTASHREFCSYRRDGAAAGRLAAVIRPSRC
jgi:polyphenol oxidase